MSRNAYAAKLVAAKAAVNEAERHAIVHKCLTTIYEASAIALNEQFGFGPERINRFKEAMEDTVREYGSFVKMTDVDYADGALERRFNQIMGIEEEGHEGQTG